MAQSIRNLALGSKIKDGQGNKFIVIAHDHYASNEVTLMTEASIGQKQMHSNYNMNLDFANSDLLNYLNNDYFATLDSKLRSIIKVTSVPYKDGITSIINTEKTVQTKLFILSLKETGVSSTSASSKESTMSYVNSNLSSLYGTQTTWTRTERTSGTSSSSSYSYFWTIYDGGSPAYGDMDGSCATFPVFNLGATALVSDRTSGGYYSFVYNEPPVIQNIANIKGNYGSPTNITYTVTDSDDTSLTHYISFDNGSTYVQINPTRVGDTYTYSHVFSELKTYYCRVKVVDSANNSTTSNGFSVEINSVAPTVNIVSVIDKVVTFKASCLTHDIAKVEIVVNDVVVKTYTSGFDFNLVYEIDRATLNVGKNAIQIKATSTGNLIGYKDIEANKTTYNLPPVGTKVIIRDNVYTIVDAEKNGSNQVYTLDSNLLTNVSKGQVIKITQDYVKVLCSLSDLENYKNFKEMKLVKSKKLKGQFEGYVEEKYELESEGRYSTIKLETERFNNNVASEIIELQQYFDYLED